MIPYSIERVDGQQVFRLRGKSFAETRMRALTLYSRFYIHPFLHLYLECEPLDWDHAVDYITTCSPIPPDTSRIRMGKRVLCYAANLQSTPVVPLVIHKQEHVRRLLTDSRMPDPFLTDIPLHPSLYVHIAVAADGRVFVPGSNYDEVVRCLNNVTGYQTV